ncbi:hypothetical protein G6F56_005834 [Rhizopus delemar]|nr:hypothetical protein G6F56_005834 [Rhizopus delemar]
MYLLGGGRIQGVQSPIQEPNVNIVSVTYPSSKTSAMNQEKGETISDSILTKFSVENKPVKECKEFNEIQRFKQISNLIALDDQSQAAVAYPFDDPSQTASVLIHLTHLDLSRMHINVLDGDIYYNMPCLKSLILSMNAIEEIPEDMPIHLPRLETLLLDGNKIMALPETIRRWKMLENLWLGSKWGGNLLEDLPESFSELNALVELNLSHNKLKKIHPGAFGAKLKRINLSYNQLKDLSGESFIHCHELEAVDLRHNQLDFACKQLMRRQSPKINKGFSIYDKHIVSGVFFF